MSLKHVSENSGPKAPPCPAGVYAGRCYGLIDIGTETSQSGQYGPKHKCVVLWELPEERIELTIDGKTVSKPRGLSSRYTLALRDSANLRQMLDSWRGRPFTAEELKDFNLTAIVGKPALLNIVHKPRKDGNGVYAKIVAVNPMPKAMQCAPQENPSVVFDMEEFDGKEGITYPAGVPEWCIKEIEASEEYARWKATGTTKEAPVPQDVAPQPSADEEADRLASEIDSEDVPF